MRELESLKQKLRATDNELVEALGIVIEDVKGNLYKVTYEDLVDKLEQSIKTLRRC